MMRLSQALEAKERGGSRLLVTVSPANTVLEAIHLLCKNRIGALLVIDSEDHLAGIISERDVLKACCRDHSAIDRTPVGDIMSRELVVGHPTDTVQQALQAMTTRKVRHLPVINQNSIIGILSIGDIIRRLYSQDELKIRQMSDCFGGTYGPDVY